MRRGLTWIRRRVGTPVAVTSAFVSVTTIALATLLVTGGGARSAALEGIAPRPARVPPPAATTTSATPSPESSPTSTTRSEAGPIGGGGPIDVGNPAAGSGRWEYAGAGPGFGSGGQLRTYRVAVEVGLPVSVAEFTAVVDATLGDYRGWASTGQASFQRVDGSASSNFTVFLASPWTAYQLCGGSSTSPSAVCRTRTARPALPS